MEAEIGAPELGEAELGEAEVGAAGAAAAAAIVAGSEPAAGARITPRNGAIRLITAPAVGAAVKPAVAKPKVPGAGFGSSSRMYTR
jgi:hypothetical protein